MGDYVYIASERVDNLYGTLSTVLPDKEKLETKVGFSIASVTYTTEASTDISVYEKINYILQQIDIVDALADDKDNNATYINGSLPMSWNSQNRIDSHLSSTFWIGAYDTKDKTPYDETVLLLIGSDRNIVGNSSKAGQYYSTSYIDAFFASMEKSLNPTTFSLDRIGSRDRANEELERLLFYKSLPHDESIDFVIKSHYKGEWTIARYIRELREYYQGNYFKYNFVAQLLYSKVFLDEEERIIRYIIGAPLFVQRAEIIGKRTLHTKKGNKYILSEAEFSQHKKNHYSYLHGLLLEEGLVKEEAELTARLKNVYQPLERDKTLVSTEMWKRFHDKADIIVMDYLYVLPAKSAIDK